MQHHNNARKRPGRPKRQRIYRPTLQSIQPMPNQLVVSPTEGGTRNDLDVCSTHPETVASRCTTNITERTSDTSAELSQSISPPTPNLPGPTGNFRSSQADKGLRYYSPYARNIAGSLTKTSSAPSVSRPDSQHSNWNLLPELDINQTALEHDWLSTKSPIAASAPESCHFPPRQILNPQAIPFNPRRVGRQLAGIDAQSSPSQHHGRVDLDSSQRILGMDGDVVVKILDGGRPCKLCNNTRNNPSCIARKPNLLCSTAAPPTIRTVTGAYSSGLLNGMLDSQHAYGNQFHGIISFAALAKLNLMAVAAPPGRSLHVWHPATQLIDNAEAFVELLAEFNPHDRRIVRLLSVDVDQPILILAEKALSPQAPSHHDVPSLQLTSPDSLVRSLVPQANHASQVAGLTSPGYEPLLPASATNTSTSFQRHGQYDPSLFSGSYQPSATGFTEFASSEGVEILGVGIIDPANNIQRRLHGREAHTQCGHCSGSHSSASANVNYSQSGSISQAPLSIDAPFEHQLTSSLGDDLDLPLQLGSDRRRAPLSRPNRASLSKAAPAFDPAGGEDLEIQRSSPADVSDAMWRYDGRQLEQGDSFPDSDFL
jgi:hypothetical protein